MEARTIGGKAGDDGSLAYGYVAHHHHLALQHDDAATALLVLATADRVHVSAAPYWRVTCRIIRSGRGASAPCRCCGQQPCAEPLSVVPMTRLLRLSR